MFIPIPLGRSWAVTLRQPVASRFACAACGWKSPVIVKAVTRGRGMSPMFLDDRGAQQRAYEEAEDAIAAAVSNILALVPCPKCGAPGPGFETLEREGTWQAAALAGVACLVSFTIGVIVAAATDSLIALVGGGVASIAVAWFVFTSARKYSTGQRVRQAQSAVAFGEHLRPEDYGPVPGLDLPSEPAPEAVPQAPIDDPIPCPKCGKQTSASAEYCWHCLAKI